MYLIVVLYVYLYTCISFRKTPGNEPLYMPVGTAYVYSTYGMYCCFNVSGIEPGSGVLIRALEPLEGIEHMKSLRAGTDNYTSYSNYYLRF